MPITLKAHKPKSHLSIPELPFSFWPKQSDPLRKPQEGILKDQLGFFWKTSQNIYIKAKKHLKLTQSIYTKAHKKTQTLLSNATNIKSGNNHKRGYF